MESGLKSLSSAAKSPSLMARVPYYCYSTIHHLVMTDAFPRSPAPGPPQQPPLLPLPVHLRPSPQCTGSLPASLPVLRTKKPRHAALAPATANVASAPIVVAAPSKKRMAMEVEWAPTDSLYSVSPPPSSVPMPRSLLATATGRKPVPTACAVEVAAGSGGVVDVGATDELRRLLGL